MPRLIRDTTNTNQVVRWFLEERANWSTRRKPLGVEKRTNKLNPHMTPDLGIEPGPHWWEASALTTAPSLHAKKERKERINISELNNYATLRLWRVSGLETLLKTFRTTFPAVSKFEEGKKRAGNNTRACARLGGHVTWGERPYWFSSTDITQSRSLNICLEFTLQTLQVKHNYALFVLILDHITLGQRKSRNFGHAFSFIRLLNETAINVKTNGNSYCVYLILSMHFEKASCISGTSSYCKEEEFKTETSQCLNSNWIKPSKCHFLRGKHRIIPRLNLAKWQCNKG